MMISGIVKSSFVDYPGYVSCVLFVPGCNYDCFYCHNRPLLDGAHPIIANRVIEEFLEKRKGLLDGVVITGGEPTLQPDLISYIQSIRSLGYKIKLDTNGSSPEVITRLLQADLCDYYAVDYKAPAERYKEIAGNDADAVRVQSTIQLLLEHNVPFEVRTTVIPQLTEEDLIWMAKELPVVPRYVLNPYRKPESFHINDQSRIDQTPYTKQQIKRLADTLRVYQPHVKG